MVTVTPETIKLRGGSLSVDFANTVDWTEDDTAIAATDALTDEDSLDRWGLRVGVLGAAGGPGELELARDLRVALHGIFSALARSGEPAASSMECLRITYAEAAAAGALSRRDQGGFALNWEDSELGRVRFAVAADAVTILADPARIARLRRCPSRDCGWIFLDPSGRRRWCSMATCGSREKMRSMYARRRDATQA